jgi:glycerol-3-phosphate dehydrogenase subunit C
MNTPTTMGQRRSFRDSIRRAVERCADCASCQDLMEQECRFFAELYRPGDGQARSGGPFAEATLRSLAERCTYCGLCPCPEIPAWLMEGKSVYAEEEGLPYAVRLLADVPRLARLCGTFPRLYEALRVSELMLPLLRTLGRIHPDRRFPVFATESFFEWAARTAHTKRKADRRQAAYFVGCTVGYLFPEVGRAVVAVLERNGVPVYVPSQRCCGMPYLVEGDQSRALVEVGSNVQQLLQSVRAGDDVVCSCPTCGFLLKVLLKEKAHYSEDYQRSVNAGEDEIKIPDQGRGSPKHSIVKKSIYRDLLKDDGCFSSVPPLARIGVAEHVQDAGEYLGRLLAEGRLDTRFAPVSERIAYFAPCHTRQQKLGRPYADLLRLIPGITVDQVGENECCGMGGNFGFKADVHKASLDVGRPVFERIEALAPDAIVTDCLSCRLQFRHALRYPVLHPMEILARAYEAGDG